MVAVLVDGADPEARTKLLGIIIVGDDDPRLVTVIPSVEMGADFLKFLRRRK